MDAISIIQNPADWNEHTPWSDAGTEMVIVFDSPTGQFIDNRLQDGTCFHLGMSSFKAIEGISLAEYDKLNLVRLLDVLPEVRKSA